MARFRSKPIEIEAVQWFKEGDHEAVISIFDGWKVRGAQGLSTVLPGDWIITEPRGDGFYPCNPDVFSAKYEPVDKMTIPEAEAALYRLSLGGEI